MTQTKASTALESVGEEMGISMGGSGYSGCESHKKNVPSWKKSFKNLF